MAEVQYEPEAYDSDEPTTYGLQTGDDAYLLSSKFDPGVWLTKAPGTKIGRSKKRWFVLHRQENQLVYYTMAFIPPARAPVKGVIKLEEITGISCRGKVIEISVTKGRTMYQLEAEDENVAADWTYILKVETQQIAPTNPNKHKELMVQYAMITPDDSYLSMDPDDDEGEKATTTTSATDADASQEAGNVGGSYLEMAPEDNSSYVPISPGGDVGASYVPVDPAVDEGSYEPLEPEDVPEIVLESNNDGFGVAFGGARNAEDAAKYGPGIFISEIKKGSPAASCPDLHVGMQLMTLNDVDLRNATFDTLSTVLQESGSQIKVKVQPAEDLHRTYTSVSTLSMNWDGALVENETQISSKPEYIDLFEATIASPDVPTEFVLPERHTDPAPAGNASDAASMSFQPELESDEGLPNYVALHDFEPRNFDEVAAARGNVFRITEIWPDGWYFGQNLDTLKIGIIPGSYLFAAVLPEGAPTVAAPTVLEVFPDRYMTLEPDPE